MSNLRLFLFPLVLLFLLRAAAGSDRANKSADPRYRLDIVDRPNEKRFNLSLKSLDRRSLCIYFDEWPNKFGQLHFGSGRVKLESSEGTYPARDENFGYCVGPSCII